MVCLSSVVFNDRDFEDFLDSRVDLAIEDPYTMKKYSAEEMQQRISDEALHEIMAQGDKQRATGDVVKSRMDLHDAERNEIMDRAAEAFKKAGIITPEQNVKISGTGYYRENCYMGWHTNRASGGTRIYCNRADQEGKSGLRYFYEGYSTHTRVMLDDIGWSFRIFKVDHVNPFWHSVFSYCNRISLGFRILEKGECREQLN